MAPKKTAQRNAVEGKETGSGKSFVDFVRSIKFRKASKASETPDCESHFAQLESPVDVRRQRFTSEDYQLIRSAN